MIQSWGGCFQREIIMLARFFGGQLANIEDGDSLFRHKLQLEFAGINLVETEYLGNLKAP